MRSRHRGAEAATSAHGRAVRALGCDFAVGVLPTFGVVRLDRNDRINEKPRSVAAVVASLPTKAFRTVTWRDGTRKKLRSRFCFVRVQTTHDDGIPLAMREPLWLVAEWPEDELSPSKFLLTTLPRRMSKKEIIRLLKERWRTERMYEDLKGELGFDHFEGRSFPGWHHHVSVVLCCYAFVVAERRPRFSPLDRRVASQPSAPSRGLNATSRTRSSPLASRSLYTLPAGSHAAQPAINHIPHHAARSNASRDSAERIRGSSAT
jgi:hypothetical protein